MAKFRVAISSDFQRADGTPAFPDFDMAPLHDDARIEAVFAPVEEGRVKPGALDDFDALILLAARCDEASLPANGRLAMVARFGVGYDNVDVPACTARNIAVVITPDGVRRPVAVSIITYILALSQRVRDKDIIARQGPAGWAKKQDYMGRGLEGRTLGSVGIGNIGAEVFRLASVFDMRFIAHDPFVSAEAARALNVELVALDDVFRQADFVSVSCPLNEETQGLVDARRLALMKPTAYLINTARGPIVDQDALTEALREGRIAGAGLDVLAVEPPPEDEPILALDNVLLAPHGLCWTDQCFAGIGAADVAAVFALLGGENPRGVVNRDILETPDWTRRLADYRGRFAG